MDSALNSFNNPSKTGLPTTQDKDMQNAVREGNLDLNSILVNSAPFVLTIWDDGFNLLAASDQAVKIFGLTDKQEYIKRFFDFSPKHQPCGSPSAEKAILMLTETLKTGQHTFEWMHQTLSGEPLPMEIAAVRFVRGERAMVAAYAIDIRPIKNVVVSEKKALDLARRFLDAAPIFIETWDNDMNLTGTNQAAVKMFGLRDTDHYMEVYEQLHPEYQPCGMKTKDKIPLVVEKVMKDGYTEGEWMHIDISGNEVPVQSCYVRFDVGNDEHYIVGYSQDLRPIRAAMAELENALKYTQNLMNSAPFFMEIWDCNLNLISCNDAAAKMFGLSSPSEYVKHFYELSPKFQPCGTPSEVKIIELVKKAVDDGYCRSEWTHIGIDGQPFPVDVVFVKLKSLEGDIIVGYNQDLRPLRIAMDKLKASEERSKTLLDASPIPSIIFDEAINAVDSNFAALTLFAIEQGSTPEKTYPHQGRLSECKHGQCIQFHVCGRDFCPLRSFLLENHRSIFAKHGMDAGGVLSELENLCFDVVRNGTAKIEETLTTLYGALIPCEITVVSVNYNDSQGFAFYLRDLREEKLRQAAEDASRAKSSFLSTVSHEIRTPLNAILGITEIRLMDSEIDIKIRDDLMKIYASSDILLKIINDILDLSRIEAGKLPISESKYETASFIGDIVQINLLHIGSKTVEFHLNVDENLPTHVLGDELRMKQILSNLLSNAFKYTEAGSVSLDIRIFDIPGSDDKLMFEIKVSDTGVGMTKQQIDILFEEFTRFYQSESLTTGTGLGMSITQKLVSLMGGKLSVESESGKGSVFTAQIPQSKLPNAKPLGAEVVENLRQFKTINAYKGSDDIVRKPMPYGKVLVVDDVDINIYVVMGLLAPYELQVEEASNGMEAIEKVKNGGVYDIIFMDHMMPEMDGIEATKIIRELGYKKPIVALTANAVSGQSEVFLSSGFDDFLSKPIDVRCMHVILNRFVA